MEIKIDLSTKSIQNQSINSQQFIYLQKFTFTMKKKVFLILSLSAMGIANSQVKLNIQRKLDKERISNHQKLDQLIKKSDKKLSKYYSDNKPSLAGFAIDFPLFWQSEDVPANTSVNLAPLKNGTLAGINNNIIDGTNINIFVFDGGKAHVTHNEFNNTGTSRAINLEDNSTYVGGTKNGQPVVNSSHATNVTGIILGAGINPIINWTGGGSSPAGYAEGVLKNATTSNYLFEQTNLGTNYDKLKNYSTNISNHSYGAKRKSCK